MARAMSRPPRADAAIAAELSRRFRAGELYSYSYDPAEAGGSGWLVWLDEHDWRHELRNGVRRCACCAPEMVAAGAVDMTREALLAWLRLPAEAPKRLSKAELVRRLRALDLPAAAVELLDAA
jgi:hypothetical protein